MSTSVVHAPVAVHRPAPARAWALAGLGLTMLLSSLGTGIANVGLPTIAKAFGAPFASVRWVVLAYLLAVTVLVVAAGRLGDRFGRRRLLLSGIALFTLASVACASADRLDGLIAARAVQGIGGALMMALTLALVGEIVARDRVGRAMGLLGTLSAIGTALGPPLGGALIDRCGWPALFLVNLPLGVVALLLVGRGLPRDRRDPAGAFAGDGAVPRPASSSPSRLLRNRELRNGLAGSTLASTVAMTTLVVGPFYLSGALHLGATDTGLAMSAGPLVAAVAGVPAGRGVDRWGAARMVAIGLVAMALGAAALAAVSAATGLPGYVLPVMLLTAGFAIFQTGNNTAVLGAAEADQRGLVSGGLHLSRHLGFVAGASAMGTIYASQADVVSGTRTAFAVATGLIVAALLIPRFRHTGGTMRRILLDRHRKLRNGWWILIFFLMLGVLVVPATLFAAEHGVELDPGLQAVLVAIATAACLALRREPPRTVLGPWRSWPRDAALGLALGAGVWLITASLLWATGSVRWTWQDSAASLAGGAVACLGVALVEELVFRGFIFQRLIAGIGTWPAQIIMAAYFVLTHSTGIASAGDVQPLAMFNIFVAGLMFGAAWLRTRALALPIALHFALNFTQGPVLGFGISGNTESGLLQPTLGDAPHWWTGGAFGLEASVPGTLMILLALRFLLRYPHPSREPTDA